MRTARALFLVTLLLLTPLSLMATPAMATDTSVNVDTTWSGDVVLNGNVTVMNGSTLTLSPGTTVDGGDGYWIRVDGTLDASNAHFFSSQTPVTAGSHGAGLWTGIYVASKGHAVLNDVVLENAKTAIKVDGQLSAFKTTIKDSYIGINVIGSADIDTITAEHIDYEVVRNSGHLNLSSGTFTDVAGGVWSTGTSTVDTITISQAGTGLRSSSGSLSASGIGFFDTTVAVASQQGASTTVQSLTADNVALLIDAADSDDLTVSSGAVSGQRLLLANGASSFSIEDIVFEGRLSDTLAIIDQRCIGTCSWSNLEISNVTNGIFLSGSGNHSFSGLDITAAQRGIEGTGSGHIHLASTNLTAGTKGIEMRDPSSTFEQISISMTSHASTALDVLDGDHQWTSISAVKGYLASDVSSIGLKAWYASIDSNTLSLVHFGNGILADHADISGQSILVQDGKGVGIELEQSSLQSDSLETRAYPEGVTLKQTSQLHVSDWTASTHTSPLSISTYSTATIRDFQPQNTQPSSSDALGDGTLIYGGSTTANIAVSSAAYLEETPVTFTDLTGNPVQATINVHGFTMQSGANGGATLPLLSSGSSVDVTLAGAGVRVVLFGSQMGQSVQVPVIPQGDWTISTGQFVFLGPRPDGSPHTMSGDLTLSTGSGLELSGTSLILPPSGVVDVEGSAELTGSDSSLEANSVSLGIDSVLTQSDGGMGLTLEANATWVCQTTRSVSNVIITGSLLLQPGCSVEMLEGNVEGTVTALTSAELTILSSLYLTVLDKGEPVEGALISIDGAVTNTDSNGEVSTTATARYVNDNSQTTGGIKNINLQIGSFMDFVTWDSSASFEHVFMASTVAPGSLSNWLILEAQWSPYFLDGDLAVEASGTLTIDDGVSLRISDGSKISVDGRIDAGSATLSSTGLGSRWGGFVMGGAGSTIDLSQTSIFEASPALNVESQGTFIGDGLTIARSSGADPLVLINSNSQANITLKNAQLYDAGNGCIKAFPSSTELTLSEVTFETCNGVGIWARQIALHLDEITVGSNVSTGFDFTAVTGSMSNIDASMFDGEGNILALDSIDGDFPISHLNGTVGAGAGITGSNSRSIQMSHIQLTGSPGIDFDNSAGQIEDVILNGPGSGTGFISHHGRTSDSLIVEHIIAFSYSVGIDLHADEGDGALAPFILRNPDIISSTVLSSENYPARIEGGITYGAISASGPISIDLIDTTTENPSMYDGAELRTWNTYTLNAKLNGVLTDVDYSIHTEGLNPAFSTTVYGSSPLVELPVSFAGNGTASQTTSFSIQTQATGLPNVMEWWNDTSITLIELTLVANNPPTVEITEPYSGQRVMESVHLLAAAEYADDLDASDDLNLVWIITDSSGVEVMRGPSEAQYNITDLQYGLYVLELRVTDTLGATSTAAVDFEVTELDSDGDWTNTCVFTLGTGVWFDSTNGYSCGPDSEDTDDDNDGHPDTRDAWPVDPCAWQDTDNDGYPNSISCPEGVTTYLTEDQDDDGDGVLDLLESNDSSESGDFSTATLLLLVLIVAAIALFMTRMRRGGGELGDLDERHL